MFYRCYELLCETMAHNSEHDLYTLESFVLYLRSLPRILIAKHADGRLLGFYSGAIIGHDHSQEFRSWGVYHNLFIEFLRQGLASGAAVVDLGNTNDAFKVELGGTATTVMFEVRTAASMGNALALLLWAVHSVLPGVDLFRRLLRHSDCRALVSLPWRLVEEGFEVAGMHLHISSGLLALFVLFWMCRSTIASRWMDVLLIVGSVWWLHGGVMKIRSLLKGAW